MLEYPSLLWLTNRTYQVSIDAAEVEKVLTLHELTGHLYHVQGACAITGDGLDEALDHLYGMIVKRRKAKKLTKKQKR